MFHGLHHVMMALFGWLKNGLMQMLMLICYERKTLLFH
jgi:hypothetical protein